MKQVHRCPCGKRIVSDDVARVMRHENPVCDVFTRGMQACGMTPIVGPWVEVVDPLTGKVKEPVEA